MTSHLSVPLTINAESYRVDVSLTRTLLSVLRDDLGLTGTKRGCDQGVCGACTVLCDDVPVRSCLALAVAEAGRDIVTIEGLERDGQPSRVQRSIVAAGAIQCGYCIPGIVVAAEALLLRQPQCLTREQVRDALGGHLCRCSGYLKIIDAIISAAEPA